MIRLWRSHPIALTGFVVATLVTAFFVVRLTVLTVYWSDPAHRNLAPQPWMSVGYVARSWGVAPEDLVEKTGLPPLRHSRGHPMTLAEIAAQRGMAVEVLIAEIQLAIHDLQTQGARH